MDTGDVVVFRSGMGHAGLIYDDKRAVHGQVRGNFHFENLRQDNDGKTIYFAEKCEVYSFPWDKYTSNAKANYQAEIRKNADEIMKSAKYGLYRAARLQFGSSQFGPKAMDRLQKYKNRIRSGQSKTVSTITCAEAVILVMQLSFLKGAGPGFIELDAAHTMPRTLAKWLKNNWGTPSRW